MSTELTVCIEVHGDKPGHLYARATVEGEFTTENLQLALADIPATLAELYATHYGVKP